MTGVCSVGLIAAVLILRPALPELTRESFEAARVQWETNGPADYDIRIRVSGRQAAVYQCEVRSGKTRTATRNGLPLNRRTPPETWSVSGMFNTMEIDLENMELRASGREDDTTPRLRLRCRFDKSFGFPSEYHRTEFRDRGANYDVTFEVIEFTPIVGD